jgi:diguanylate cyclase (GGDEF)-like protein
MLPAASGPQTQRGDEQAPRLVLRFACFTALGLAAAAAAILLVVRHADTVQAERQAIGRARLATAAVLTRELRATDLAGRPSAKRRRELDRLFRERVLLEGIGRATIFRADLRPLFSTEPGPPESADARRHVREALTGRVVSSVESADSDKVLRTYVPLKLEGGRIAGIVALDEDYSAVEAAARETSWLIVAVLEGLLVVLCLILLPVLARASSRIRRHVSELEHRAATDELTCLPNRVGFRRAGERALAGTSSRHALLLCDVDGFSEINDMLGSESGDELLAEVASRLARELDGTAILARLGEDEFGILVEASDRRGVMAFVGRIRRGLGYPYSVGGMPIALSVSVGAAFVEDDIDALPTAVRKAGAALSAARCDGAGGFELFDEAFEARDAPRLTLIAELRKALLEDELEVHYQPLADVSTRRIRGVEALMRWQHPERGLLTASEFIAEAERSGLTRELRRLVLHAAASQWREWRALGFELEIAVNLSAVDLLDVSLPKEIAELLERYELPPWNLVLELTERALIGDERRAVQVIERTHALGVRFAVDDFGTGYSSLASLLRAPVKQVKLDHSLLAGVPGDPAAEAIVTGSVELAHALGAAIVAEGIETYDQWVFVCDIGCDIAQGYLIGEPAPASEITALLEGAPSVTDLVAA